MPKSKKPRKAKVAWSVKMARAEQSKRELIGDLRRAHYTKQIAALNELHRPHVIERIFAPIEKAVYDIERTGDVDVDQRGTAVFQPRGEDDDWLELSDALRAHAATFNFAARDNTFSHALVLLANKLDAAMPLFQADIDAARACFNRQRVVMAAMTPNELRECMDQALEHGPESLKQAA